MQTTFIFWNKKNYKIATKIAIFYFILASIKINRYCSLKKACTGTQKS